MKKTLVILLTFIMLISVAITPVFAENAARDGAVFEVSHYNPKYPTNGVTEDKATSNNIMATSELCTIISETCYAEILRFEMNKIYVGLPYDCVDKVKEIETVLEVKPYEEAAFSSNSPEEKISAELKGELETLNQQDTIDAVVWLSYNPAIYYGFCEEDFSDPQDYLESKRAVNAKYHEEINKKFFEEIASTVNLELNGVSKQSPIIYVSLQVSEVEKLAQLSCVDSLGYEVTKPTEPPTENDKNKYIYEDKFVSKYKCKEYYYDELYYHKSDDGNVDWVLVEGDVYAGAPFAVKQVVLDRVLTYAYMAEPFVFGYSIYDVEADEFVSLNGNQNLTRFKDLEGALNKIKLGNPLGDADLDGELTILDATYIQMVVAKLCDCKPGDYVGEYYLNGGLQSGFDYISDIDMDGEINILDATSIQLKIAKVEA